MVVVTRKKSKLKGVTRLGAEVNEVLRAEAAKATEKSVAVVVEANEASKKPATVRDLSSILGTIKEDNKEVEEEDMDMDVDVEAVAATKAKAETRTKADAESRTEAKAESAAKAVDDAMAAAAAATTKTTSDDDSIVEAFEKPVLEESTNFTIDKNTSLDYQLLADPDQPLGRRRIFTREDLTKFIRSTENKYCLVISKPPWLQFLHLVFMWGNWVYASTSYSVVDNYWMRIPVKSLVVPMKSLDFKLWQREGSSVPGPKLPIHILGPNPRVLVPPKFSGQE